MSTELSIIWDFPTIADALVEPTVMVGAITSPSLSGVMTVNVTATNSEFDDVVRFKDSFDSVFSNSSQMKALVAAYFAENPQSTLTINITDDPRAESRAISFFGEGHLIVIATAQTQARYLSEVPISDPDSAGYYHNFTLAHIIAHEFAHILTGMKDGPAFNALVNAIIQQIDGSAPRVDDYDAVSTPYLQIVECFASGTLIDLIEESAKPIEFIRPGDTVLSYTADGALVSGRVNRTFQKDVTHLLDVHGLKVTPGHVTLCGDGMFNGRHVPIIDILLSDGALVTADGALVRIATNAPVGSLADAFVKVAAALTPEDVAADRLTEGEMRVGTLLFDRDGSAISVLHCLKAEGYAFDPETGLVAKQGEAPQPLHWFGPIPRPEDYVLRRSRETLADIVTGGEWEGSPSVLIAARLQHTLGRVH